jgi:hypothetical protein
MPIAHEYYSAQFQKWEVRGRGWQVFDEPVKPEPPFVPFRHTPMSETPVADNGSRPSLLGSLFRKALVPKAPSIAPEPEEEPQPEPLARDDALTELQVTLPADLDIAQDSMERLFRNLSVCREPVAFELAGTPGRVFAQFAANERDALLVRKQLTAHFPGVLFREKSETLAQAWADSSGDFAYVVDFGLEREFMLPLVVGKLDAFIGIVSALAGLEQGELAVFQVLWQPVVQGWAESIVNSVTDGEGKPFFVDAPELAKAAEAKVALPLYAVVVRILVRAATERRFEDIAYELAGSLGAFSDPQGNALIPLHNDDYPFEEHVEDVILRQTRRSGMILNSEELFGFVHLPSEAVRAPELMRDEGQTKAAPSTKPGGLLLGDNEHNGTTVPVYLSPDQRVRHTHIIGIPGTGKSSLLFNLIRQDIKRGDGVGILDPHGDLVDQLLGVIPEHRVNDVVLVDLTDKDFPIGFNILQAHSEDEKALLASDLIGVLRRFSTSWGDQMDIVLLNAIMAFLESSRGGTLADLRRFLLETPYRNQFLKTVADPELRYYWEQVFSSSNGGKSIGSVLTRLQDFFSRKPLRNMVSQQVNRLDFADIMDGGKIFLAKLPEGLNGAENVHLLGSLLVAKFQQTAMARQSQIAANRRDFWLYVDEFDHFITPSMATILTGARKYRMGLTLAHQELHQLEAEPKVASAVNASVCTRIALRVGNNDAKKLAEGFPSFETESLTSLENFHAIARIERNDNDFNLALRMPELPGPEDAERCKAGVVAASRAKYGTPRAEVEAAWLAGLGLTTTAAQPIDSVRAAEPPPPVTPTPPAAAAEVPKDSEVPKPPEIPKVAEPPPKKEPLATPQGVPSLMPRDSGRGGAQHQAIQKRIKEAAEALGFRSVIERPVLDGQGSVDLWLERTGHAIGCEISVTTTIDHEVRNVSKCLKADVPKVAVICLDDARLRKIGDAVAGSLGAELAAQVEYFQPDQFIAYLKTLPMPAPLPSETEFAGYKVKRSYPQLTPEEQKRREDIGHRTMADAIKQNQTTPRIKK